MQNNVMKSKAHRVLTSRSFWIVAILLSVFVAAIGPKLAGQVVALAVLVPLAAMGLM